MNVAIYIRVSSLKKVDIGKGRDNPFLQNPDVQMAPLKKFTEFRGWTVTEVYQDRMTGSKNEQRTGYTKLWNDARKGKFQAVIVWRFDRFARSTVELLKSLDEFRSLGIAFISHTENIDTTTPMGKATFGMVAVFAEFERSIMIERINAGIVRAKEHGSKSGNSIGRPKAIFDRSKAMVMREQGASIRGIASELGVSPAIVHRELRGVSKPPSGSTAEMVPFTASEAA